MSELTAKRASDSVTEMTQLLLPGDANSLGAACGGSVMGWIDICAAVCAQRHCRQTVVTASMDDLHFHAPITVGMAVTLKARVIAAFTSSMEIGVTVHSENPHTGERKLTTSALLTFFWRSSNPRLIFLRAREGRIFMSSSIGMDLSCSSV